MGEAAHGQQLQGDLAPEDEVEEEKKQLMDPKHHNEEDSTKNNKVDSASSSSSSRKNHHQEHHQRPLENEEKPGPEPKTVEERPDDGSEVSREDSRSGVRSSSRKRTRWDPLSASDQPASTMQEERQHRSSSRHEHGRHGHPDHHSDSRKRHSDHHRRSGSVSGSGSAQPSSSRKEAGRTSDRGTTDSSRSGNGGRNGFDHRWSSSRSSRERYRDNGYDRFEHRDAGYDHRRSDHHRDGYDRGSGRDYRDQRRGREMDEWQNPHNLRATPAQWTTGPLLETPRYHGHPSQVVTFQHGYPVTVMPMVALQHPVEFLQPHPPPPPPPASEQMLPPPLPMEPPPLPPEPQGEAETEYEDGQLLPEEEEEGLLVEDEPPAAVVAAVAAAVEKQHGDWVYINENGDVQGPMKLKALQLLASNGFMQEDHLVSRVGSNAWVTLEKAWSPENESEPEPEQYTEFKPHPVASPRTWSRTWTVPDAVPRRVSSEDSEMKKRFDIDVRVDEIMKDRQLVHGKESEMIAEALDAYQRSFGPSDGDSPELALCNPWLDSDCELGFGVDSDISQLRKTTPVKSPVKQKVVEQVPETKPAPIPPALPSVVPSEVPLPLPVHSATSSPVRFAPETWTSKGGDWKLIHPEGQSSMKMVLNHGSLLCDRRDSGLDPRRQIHQQEGGRRRKYELPPWVAGLGHRSEGRTQNSIRPKPNSALTSAPTSAPNSAQKAKAPASAVKVPMGKPAEKEPSRVKVAEVKPEQVKAPVVERPRTKFVDIRTTFTVDLGRGDWFYKNGSGHEQGPYSFSDLQGMVAKGLLMEGLSVYRKSDDVWVSLPHPETKDPNFRMSESSSDRRRSGPRRSLTTNVLQTFMGYTNGQLYEHVLKHYKNQVLSAFLYTGIDAHVRACEARRKLEAPVVSDEVHGRSGGYLSHSSSNDTSEEALRDDGESRVSVKRAFKGLESVDSLEVEQPPRKKRRQKGETTLSISEGPKPGGYLSPSSSNDTSEVVREDEVVSSKRGPKSQTVNGELRPCKKRRLVRNGQRKGKVGLAVKKRKVYAKDWSDMDRETSDEDDGKDETFEAEDESESGSSEVEATGALDYEAQPCEDLPREWGARMTKAAMVPPVTRTYEVIRDYSVVVDNELVERRMKVEVPDDMEEKLRASKLKAGGDYSHLDVPEIKEFCPRRELGEEVVEQEVYGIDPYTHNMLFHTLPEQPALTDSEKRQFIEEKLLQALNMEARQFTGTGKAPMQFSLEVVVERMVDDYKGDATMGQICEGLLMNMRSEKISKKDQYVAYRKGLGVVCNKEGGFGKDDFVVGFLGEVYPPWRWYEKQDGCRALQKKEKDPAPEFYNIMLERPKGDAAGYDLLVVDAMHKANYASRICHSCRPNCEAKVTAVNSRYTIGVYTLRPIRNGEELTFDYNSVTESYEEYNNSICLCGSQGCRGSYLNLAGGGTFQEVIKERHGLLDRHALLLEACCDGPVTKLELDEMKMSGVGSCLLEGLPDWLLKYTARVVDFMNLERQQLPDELMRKCTRNNKRMYDMERADAEVQAEGVFGQRLQNLAITLDKVRYVLRQFFTDPREAPPLLKKLDQKEVVERLWSGENSVVNDLLKCMEPHTKAEDMEELRSHVQKHAPDDKGDGRSLRESLLWLRDHLRSLSCTVLSRHDAAADLIHMYAYTQCFFTSEEYGSFESPPLQITAQDLGRHASTASYTWKKVYKEDYVLGQLIYWFKQSAANPGSSLVQARRGCLVLPDASSCYAKSLQQDSRRAYGTRAREVLLPRMERQPQKQWPKSLWDFKSNRGLFGSPMMDAVQRGGRIDAEMMHWLKSRPVSFVGPYDA